MGRRKPAETTGFLAFSDLGMSLYVPLRQGTPNVPDSTMLRETQHRTDAYAPLIGIAYGDRLTEASVVHSLFLHSANRTSRGEDQPGRHGGHRRSAVLFRERSTSPTLNGSTMACHRGPNALGLSGCGRPALLR